MACVRRQLCQLRWAQIDLRHGRLHVNRAKGGCASVHPLHGPELRALRPLQGSGPYVFVTEAATPTTTAWFLRMRLISTAFAICLLPAVANAQVIIDMGAFTCDQHLAMSPAMSRDFSAWMSGWFSNQTGKRVVDVLVHQKNIAIVKSWCQSNPQAGVMTALQSAIGPQ